MKILLLSYWFPLPVANGSQVRLWNLSRRLARQHEISIASFRAEPVTEGALAEGREVYRDIHLVDLPPAPAGAGARLQGWVSPKPAFLAGFHSPEMEAIVRDYNRRGDLDLMLSWELTLAPFALLYTKAPRFAGDIEASFGFPVWSSSARGTLQRFKHRAYLRGLARHFAGFGTVSEYENGALRRILGRNGNTIRAFPNGVDLANLPYHEPAGGAQLIYYGSLSYSANRDAVDWFCSEIFPLILERRPDTRLVVTGRHEDRWTPASARRPEVRFTGFLDDPRAVMTASAVSVVPLRVGGGTRLKILEAMAQGTPVVSTTIGSEGLELESGREIEIADSPRPFADAVLRLLADRDAAKQRSRAARQRVERDYNWDEIALDLDHFLRELVGESHRAAPVAEAVGS